MNGFVMSFALDTYHAIWVDVISKLFTMAGDQRWRNSE